MDKEISYSGFVQGKADIEVESVSQGDGEAMVQVFMSSGMLETIIEDYDYWSHQLSHDAESFMQSHNYKVIADNLREYSDES
tara:strand:+ start:122 stop:367 length:246 start_codon:yes stop_codon:yes gene_type:complete